MDARAANRGLDHIVVGRGRRHFATADGASFLPIGFNDAPTWPTLHPLRWRGGREEVEAYLRSLAASGVNLLRVMLEYRSDEGWWAFEDEAGTPRHEAVRFWDRLVRLCELVGVRLLVVFWDTFHLERDWQGHPYSRRDGFAGPETFLTAPPCLQAQRARLRFVAERWGRSPAIFGYDVFNEISAAWGGCPDLQARWVGDAAVLLRRTEAERWGASHLVTASLFGARPGGAYAQRILAHPELDFVSTHAYDFGTMDDPSNLADCALVMRDAVLYARAGADEPKPYLDTEHGPIHLFLNLRRQLPEAIDDEYFHTVTWAHLATGGAGSGMRWPYRHPHRLTPGMLSALRALAAIARMLDWAGFDPDPADHRVRCVGEPGGPCPPLVFGCADARQWLLWLLHDDRPGRTAQRCPRGPWWLILDAVGPGSWTAVAWNTADGTPLNTTHLHSDGRGIRLAVPPFARDLAVTLRRN